MAAHDGKLEIINCLLKAGADPNAPEEVSVLFATFFYLRSKLRFSLFISCLYMCLNLLGVLEKCSWVNMLFCPLCLIAFCLYLFSQNTMYS